MNLICVIYILFAILIKPSYESTHPALLLTTYDSVSIVYPKEMGYEKDFIQIIYKIAHYDVQYDVIMNATNEAVPYRIEDAVYDNIDSSVYIIISYTDNAGCELIKLKQIIVNGEPITSQMKNAKQLLAASNWSKHVLMRNTSISVLSMEINEKKRKIYWLEYNRLTSKWSLVIMRLDNSQSLNVEFEYFTFDDKSIEFSNDGYSFISVVFDNENNFIDISNRKQHLRKKKNRMRSSEIAVFITNNDILNLCYLSTLTCKNFLENKKELEYDYETQLNNPLAIPSFGRLMGIQFDTKERSLYVADYGYDRVYKILLDIRPNEFVRSEHMVLIKPSRIQNVLQSASGQLPINPLMAIVFDSHIFWTDFEDGLKSTVYKSACIRPVYRVKNATTLKLIQITPKSTTKNVENEEIQKLPPDYDFYANKLKSNSKRSTSLLNLFFLVSNLVFIIF